MKRVRPHIVIVGGGFAGQSCLQALAHCQADVTLVDQTDHHLFQPLLYLAGTGGLDPDILATSLDRGLPNRRKMRFVQDRLTGIDRDRQTVHLAEGGALHFDYLVLATGAQTNWFGNPAWKHHAFDLKTQRDARMLAFALENVPPQARIAVIGGGPTGVEIAGALADRQVDPNDPVLSDKADVMLIEAGGAVLPSYRKASQRAAAKALSRRGVRLGLRARVDEVGTGGLQVSRERIEADLVIWAAGVEAVPLGDWLEIDRVGSGGIPVGRQLSLADGGPAAERIFVVGDSADTYMFGPRLPKLAPVAKEMGQFAGRVIAQRVRGLSPPRRFRMTLPGAMAVIGQGDAVAELGPVNLSGEAAWALWVAAHIAFLPGNDKRLRTIGRFARLPETPTRPADNRRRLATARLLPGRA